MATFWEPELKRAWWSLWILKRWRVEECNSVGGYYGKGSSIVCRSHWFPTKELATIFQKEMSERELERYR